jgi:hypothetical protein
MIIEDATGSGWTAKVTKESELIVLAHTVSQNHEINHEKQESYVLYSDLTSGGAGNTVLYIKNTDTTNDIVVNWYRFWSGASAEAIDIIFGQTGTAVGTAVTPTNMTVGSGTTAIGTFLEGTDITGLSGGVQMDRIRLSGDGKDVVGNYPGDIIIPRNGSISLQTVDGSIATEISLSFYYTPKE